MGWFKKLSFISCFSLIALSLFLIIIIISAVISFNHQRTLVMNLATNNVRFFSAALLEEMQQANAASFPDPDIAACYNPSVLKKQGLQITGNQQYMVKIISLDSNKGEYTPDVYEAQQMQWLKAGRLDETFGVMAIKKEKTLLYLRPLIAKEQCLECHGRYHAVPERMREFFPPGSRIYNHRPGQIMGAIVVSAPLTPVTAILTKNLQQDLLLRGGGMILVVAVLVALINSKLLLPLNRLKLGMTERLTTGKGGTVTIEEFPAEISDLARSWNAVAGEGDITQEGSGTPLPVAHTLDTV